MFNHLQLGDALTIVSIFAGCGLIPLIIQSIRIIKDNKNQFDSISQEKVKEEQKLLITYIKVYILLAVIVLLVLFLFSMIDPLGENGEPPPSGGGEPTGEDGTTTTEGKESSETQTSETTSGEDGAVTQPPSGEDKLAGEGGTTTTGDGDPSKPQTTVATSGDDDNPPLHEGVRDFGYGHYEGQLNQKNEPDGTGKMDYIAGEKYDGEWRYDSELNHSFRDGIGTMSYSNGDTYVGPWKNDMKHGEDGTYTWKQDGSTYIGSYENDKRSGKGTYTGFSGTVYENETWEGTYEGEFKEGVFYGKGTFELSNGDSFIGYFENGQVVSGTYTKANGVKRKFADGKEIK